MRMWVTLGSIGCHIEIQLRIKLAPSKAEGRDKETWSLLIYLRDYYQLYMKSHQPQDCSVIWANKVSLLYFLKARGIFILQLSKDTNAFFFFLKDLLEENNNNSQISGSRIMWEYFYFWQYFHISFIYRFVFFSLFLQFSKEGRPLVMQTSPTTGMHFSSYNHQPNKKT